VLKLFFPDLKDRSSAPELMDLPDSSELKLFNTLRQFTFSNFLLSRSRTLMKKYFLADMLRAPERTYTLLDLGAGACDLPLWFCRACSRRHLKIQITCLELDPRTAAFAREKCRRQPLIQVVEGSALDLNSLPAHDYVFSNHFLHHLSAAQIPLLLEQMAHKTKRRFVLNDIRRSRWAYAGFTLLAGLGAYNSFTFYDGRLSIRKAFTPAEMQTLIAHCQARARISLTRYFPVRLVLSGPGTEVLA
jgi:hypothetical protein